MSVFVNVLFIALWMIVGFAALRFGLRSYFQGPGRATAAAAAIVVAFAVGANWPFSNRAGSTPIAPAAPEVPGPVAATSSDQLVRGAVCPASASIAPHGFGYADQLNTSANAVVERDGQISAAHKYTVMGWSGDIDHAALPTAVCLIVDGHIVPRATAMLGYSRPDVAKVTGIAALGGAGFVITIPPGTLSRGKHDIGVAAMSHDKSIGMLNNSWNLLVR